VARPSPHAVTISDGSCRRCSAHGGVARAQRRGSMPWAEGARPGCVDVTRRASARSMERRGRTVHAVWGGGAVAPAHRCSRLASSALVGPPMPFASSPAARGAGPIRGRWRRARSPASSGSQGLEASRPSLTVDRSTGVRSSLEEDSPIGASRIMKFTWHVTTNDDVGRRATRDPNRAFASRARRRCARTS
jgi:hypothetical protein